MLSVRSLSFSFEHRNLFQGVSFDLKPGELIHLTGSNGVGKSTFLSILAGLRSPDKGQIAFTGPGGSPVEDLKTVCAYLSAESNGLYLKMDAYENLRFWSGLRGLKPGEGLIRSTLSHWGLGNSLLIKNFPVEQFSTGMRRRLGLARLGLSQAPCWLLDEPVYGLDQKGIDLFRQSLKAHLGEGGMAILISHDLTALSGLASTSLSLDAVAKNDPAK